MEPSPAYPPSPQPTGGVPRWLAPTALALAGVWAVGWTVVGQFGGWLAEQVLVVYGYPDPPGYWPGLTVLIALLAGAPAALLGLLIKRPVLAGLARMWAVAAGFAAVLGLVRFVPWSAGDSTVSGLAALVTLGLVLLLARRERRRRIRVPRTVVQPPRAGGVGAVGALAVGLAGAAPWWWAGALGGPFDVLLAGVSALALGALVARVRQLGSVRVPVGGPVVGLILDALVVTVPLALLAGASGPAGGQLALLITLPAAALAVASTDPRRLLPATLLVAGVAFGPLGLVDGEEVTLLLFPGDVLRWVGIGALTSWLVLLLVGVVTGGSVVTTVFPPGRRPAVAGVLVAALVLASAVIWLGAGETGFHGDRLFVVLKSQAKLTAATGIPTARRAAVYDRLVAQAERTQAPLLRALDKVDAHPTSFYLVNAIEVDDNPLVRAVLATRHDVASVRPNPELRPVPSLPGPDKSAITRLPVQPANLITVKAPQAWAEGVDGTGLVVGFSDSGVDAQHPALKTRVSGGVRSGYRGGADSWYDPWNHTTIPTDPNGHGTHTAGSAVGRGTGVAPGATWIGCANLARPLGNPAYYVSCLQFMLAPFRAGGNPFTDGQPARGADILSNSWGCPTVEGCAAGTLEPAVTALKTAGIFVVAAAGNTGPHCKSVTDPPANYDDTFTVGASDNNGTVADFSSRGPVPGDASPKPDVVAPGEDVMSAWPGGGYKRLSGTSMAAPQVAGVVALVWQAAPSLRGDITRTAALLRTSAQPARLDSGDTACGGNQRNVVGAGLVDAAAAVTLARQLALTPR
jgi:hypothetical protein